MRKLALFLAIFILCQASSYAQNSYSFRNMKQDTYPAPFTIDDYETKKGDIETGANPVAIVGTVIATGAVAAGTGFYVKNISDKNAMRDCVKKTRNENREYWVYNDKASKDTGRCEKCCAQGLFRVMNMGILECKEAIGSNEVSTPNPTVCLEYEEQKKI